MVVSDKTYDAIVIGAGHNGLSAAAYLAKAGLGVLVLEQRTYLGGLAASQPVFQGFNVNLGSYDAGLFLPEIVADLGLANHGLSFLHSPVVVHAPQADGCALTLWRDRRRAQEEIARFSPQDGRRFPAYLDWLDRQTGVLQEVLRLAAPDIQRITLKELLPWLRVALKARRLGRKDLMELMRVLPMPVTDFLDEWFESDALKAALGAAGIMGSMQGPRSSGTTFMLLYQALHAGEAGFRASRFVQGGMGRLVEALANAARSFGAQIRAAAAVQQILQDGDRAVGVRLENGEQIHARAILSNANPRHTFFDLVGAPNLEVRFVREVKNFRYRGGMARVNLALRGLPVFRSTSTSLEEASPVELLSGHILVCPSLEYMERAYDEAKYGQVPHRLVLDAAIPSLIDPSLAPAGMHLMQINVQYAPYRLNGSNWDEQRQALGESVLAMLAEYAPGFPQWVAERQVITPLDMEREYGLAEGCIYHGEMALDQLLFMRPVPGYSDYRTPLKGLYLCGSGAHPGGGVTGAPGRNAARLILKDW